MRSPIQMTKRFKFKVGNEFKISCVSVSKNEGDDFHTIFYVDESNFSSIFFVGEIRFMESILDLHCVVRYNCQDFDVLKNDSVVKYSTNCPDFNVLRNDKKFIEWINQVKRSIVNFKIAEDLMAC